MRPPASARLFAPWWIFGLPFDCVTLGEARRRILDAVRTRTRLVFATPNLDFLREASRDGAFRDMILRCGLSLADGAPVVWLGRLLGVPVPMRVAGSSLLDALVQDPGEQGLKVFFFGGDPGLARAASEALDAGRGKATSVGWYDPGFTPLDQMSTPEIIDGINASEADLLVVALGARKGHAWIERNAAALQVPVISHLGAAIGFVSGRTRRAPRFLQAVGMEWAWRMAAEPRLVARYAGDLLFLCKVLLGAAILLARGKFRRAAQGRLHIRMEVEQGVARMILGGGMSARELPRLAEHLSRVSVPRIILDVDALSSVDSAVIGYFYQLRFREPALNVTLSCRPDSPFAGELTLHRAGCLLPFHG